LRAISGKSDAHTLRHGIKGDCGRNKAIYVALIPYDGVSGKKTISSKAPSTKLLAVALLISVSLRDFFGNIFRSVSIRGRETGKFDPGNSPKSLAGLLKDAEQA